MVEGTLPVDEYGLYLAFFVYVGNEENAIFLFQDD